METTGGKASSAILCECGLHIVCNRVRLVTISTSILQHRHRALCSRLLLTMAAARVPSGRQCAAALPRQQQRHAMLVSRVWCVGVYNWQCRVLHHILFAAVPCVSHFWCFQVGAFFKICVYRGSQLANYTEWHQGSGNLCTPRPVCSLHMHEPLTVSSRFSRSSLGLGMRCA